MAWESLVDAHVGHTLQFITLLRDRLPFEETLGRYLAEMDLTDSMATAVRTRALVNVESAATEDDAQQALPFTDAAALPAAGGDADGWRRFRPDVMVREARQRQRRNDEIEGIIQLAIARAEEDVITTHVDNAITFAALLDEFLPLARAVEHYIGAVALAGGRAQAVYQRTMARLAEVHLPRAPVPRSRVDG